MKNKRNARQRMTAAFAAVLAALLLGTCCAAGAENAAEAVQVGEELQHAHGTIVHYTGNTRDAYDPENGTELILSMAWDSVQVESDTHPEAAAVITETLAGIEDAWYTDEGNQEWMGSGYNTLLAQAEDDYAVRKEYGGEMIPLESTHTVSVLRADDEILVVLLSNYLYLGGAHGGHETEALCFDMRDGRQLCLEDLAGDAYALKTALVQEMLNLADEDADGYYSGHIDLTEREEWPAAFSRLLRDGAWYPGNDGLCLFSSEYELGSYASGITEFVIPYEKLEGLLDSRWVPGQPAAGEATFTVLPEAIVPKGRFEIVDLVDTAGENTEYANYCLLLCEGEARDVTVFSGSMTESYLTDGLVFWPEQTLWYGETLSDNALQMVLLFPGDLPTTMLRYRDGAGTHELLFSLSGLDGSILLTENPSSAAG